MTLYPHQPTFTRIAAHFRLRLCAPKSACFSSRPTQFSPQSETLGLHHPGSCISDQPSPSRHQFNFAVSYEKTHRFAFAPSLPHLRPTLLILFRWSRERFSFEIPTAFENAQSSRPFRQRRDTRKHVACLPAQ